MGYALAGGGDLNGDGLGDFVVGAPNTTAPEQQEGSVLVFLGSAAASRLAPDTTYQSNITSQMLGASLAPLGDLNADGFADVVAGATGGTGQVYIYYGGGQGTFQPFYTTESHFGGLYRFRPGCSTRRRRSGGLAASGARPDAIDCSTSSSCKLQNEPFEGIPNRFSFNELYYDTGPASAPLGSWTYSSVYMFALWPGATYHWRARSKSRSPYFPRGRWISPQARPMGESDFRTGGANVAAGTRRPLGTARLGRIAPNPARRRPRSSSGCPVRAACGSTCTICAADTSGHSPAAMRLRAPARACGTAPTMRADRFRPGSTSWSSAPGRRSPTDASSAWTNPLQGG